MWLVFGLAVAGVPLLLYLLGRRGERRLRRDWLLLLEPPGGGEDLDRVERRVLDALAAAERLLDEAVALRGAGSVEEAQRRLEEGYAALDRVSAGLLKLLAGTAAASPAVGDLGPVSPLRAEAFRHVRLARLARLHRWLHRLIPTGALRHRLRAHFLMSAVRLMRVHVWDLRFRPSPPDASAALRAFLERVAGRPPEDLLWQWAERREQWREGPRPAATSLWAVLLLVLLVALEWLRQIYRA
jgi:hypothetical protein